jgi:hypothetical protein
MKRIWSLLLLLFLVPLVSIVSLKSPILSELQAQAANLRAHQVEMLRINGIRWDKTSQQFVLDVSGKSGIARIGKSSPFQLYTELQVDRDIFPNETIILTTDTAAIRLEGALKDSDGMFQLEPQYIPWDRVNRTYTGTVFLSIKVELRNSGGNAIWSPVTASGLPRTIN